MGKKEEWEQECRDLFREVEQHKEKYLIQVNGLEIIVRPNVFSPKYFSDSSWFSIKIKDIVGNKSLLEVGTGTGIIALSAALNGAKVTATDISHDAVRNAQENFGIYGVDAEVFEGNLYDPVPEDYKFDFIFWNHPFNKGEYPEEKMLLMSGFDYNYKSLERYVRGARDYLNSRGRLLLGTGGFADMDSIERIAQENCFEPVIIDNVNMPLDIRSEGDTEFRIYELKDIK